MEYTPTQRLERLWALIQEDPDCAACFREMEEARRLLEAHTDALPPEAGQHFWALPTAQHIWFHRVLEAVSRRMRLPEEG